jgi:predicted nuclease with TOPRIM domain
MEVEKYLASFPAKAADLKGRYEKANPVQLTDIKKEIVSEQATIRSFAGTIRGFPTVGRMAGKRTQVLTSLKEGSSQLNALYNSMAKSEIDRRLAEQNKRIAEEAARLDTGGVDFAFKRYECKKTFDEMKGQFYDAVMKGAKDAEQGVVKAKDEVAKHTDEMKQNYEKDFAENQKTYNEASARLKEEISRVQEAYNQATNPNEKNALYEQLNKLRKQAADLEERFKKYNEVFASTSRVDSEECANTIKEINKFYEANKNRFAIALDSVGEQAKNATDLYYRFLEHHGKNKYGGTQTFLAAEKIAELRKTAGSAPPGYAGIDLKFLKGHIKMDKATPVSIGLTATLREMADALWKYMGATGALRMKYSAYDDTSTLPSLKFMESKEASGAVDNVLKAIDNAIIAHEKMESQNIPEVSKRSFADTLQALRSYKKDMEEYRKLIALSSGLSGTMEQYWTKAKAQNAAIDEDNAYLSRIWNRFGVARQLAEGQFAMYRLNAAQWKPGLGTTPPALTSQKVREVLDYTDILGLSKQLQLGLETLTPANFVEVKAKEGFITIRPEDLNALSSKIQGAPVSDYDAFWKFLHGLRTSAGQEGFIMECYFTVGNNLWPLFDSNSALQASAAKLKETFVKQRELADKMYSQKSMEDGQFGNILGKANQAIAVAKGYIANGQYDSAIMYYIVRDNLLTEYGRLGKKRADVDAALKGLADLIEQAKTKQVSAPQPALTQGPDQSQKVKELYAQFKQAYESKSVSAVMRCLSKQWSSGDGGNISDLQRQLQKTFTMFDEVKFSIQNLKVNKINEGQYRVNYDVTIASKIYKRNLKHEEKSNIDEEVTIDQSGQPKISKTLGGKLLSVK